jgi:two-component system sensor histidine kinase KdpD
VERELSDSVVEAYCQSSSKLNACEAEATEKPQRLLVGVGSGPLSEQLIRWAHSQALCSNCPWIAVHIETSLHLGRADRALLDRNFALARELGAEVIVIPDEDVVRGLLRVAWDQKITQIIVGKTDGGPVRRFFQSEKLLQRLIRERRRIQVRVLRLSRSHAESGPGNWWVRSESTWAEYLTALLGIVAVTLIALPLSPLLGHRAISFVYLLTVVLMASFVGRGPILLAAVASALLWDFFFTLPHYSFHISGVEDQILFATYLVVALVLGQMTARIRAHEKAESMLREGATTLCVLTQDLARLASLPQVLQSAVEHLERSFGAKTAVLLADDSGGLKVPHDHAGTLELGREDLRIAEWVFKHDRPVGKFADDTPLARVMFLPLKGGGGPLGVIGLRPTRSIPPSSHQIDLLEGFVQQIAMAIDRLQVRKVTENAKLLAESERLSKTLLNSVSHEIRTPLAIIECAGSNLAELEKSDLSESQKSLVAEIREAATRLNRLVGNVLDISRLESGHVKPKLDYYDIRELINSAVADSRKILVQHKLAVQLESELPFVRMDPSLIHQALINLLANAAFHTPAGTSVEISARTGDGNVWINVADRGPGIDPRHLGRIFDKFYRTPEARAGGTGLGLSIVKGFVESQGGEVTAANRAGGGMVFSIKLKFDASHAAEAWQDAAGGQFATVQTSL